MKFSTPVTDFGKTFKLRPTDKMLALGSCFAQVIGQKLLDRRLDILLNPMGVLYNPKSICALLTLAARCANAPSKTEEAVEATVFKAADGKFYSWLASSLICGSSSYECRRQMTCAVLCLAERLKQHNVMMLTFGTDHYYEYCDLEGEPLTVANCHKMPQRCFRERTMQVEQIVDILEQTCSLLRTINPDFKIIISISPYRYLKYGLHGSQLSKARLLLAADIFQRSHENVYYFPAYEIMNDELRDYRFYAADMLHPSDVAAQYIWQQFCANYMDSELLALIAERERELKAAAHRPHNS